ncbi:MAG: nitroreductase family protein [bacterium]|nr:nitroreductase family protein [bacterium]
MIYRSTARTARPSSDLTTERVRMMLNATATLALRRRWRFFVLVTDQARKERLREIGWRQAQFAEASLVIVLVCGDRKAHARDPQPLLAPRARGDPRRHRRRDRQRLRGPRGPAARRGLPRSGGMAAQTIMLAARAMGTTQIGFDFAAAAKTRVNLPPDHEIVMALAVGKRREDPGPAAGSGCPWKRS